MKRGYLRSARGCGMHPRRWLWTPAMLQRLRAVGDARRHAKAGALLAYSGRGMRFQPRPSTQECQPVARRVQPVQAKFFAENGWTGTKFKKWGKSKKRKP